MLDKLEKPLWTKWHILPLAVTICAVVFQNAAAWGQTTTPPVLELPLNDKRSEFFDKVREKAASLSRGDAIMYSSIKEEEVVFEGPITITDKNQRLAIFSDDGCDVEIQAQEGKDANIYKPLSRKGIGQPLPDLSKSLHKVPFSFDRTRINPADPAGEEMILVTKYKVRITYSNTSYTGSSDVNTTSDVDGATLFIYKAYSPPPTPTPTPTPPDGGGGAGGGGAGGGGAGGGGSSAMAPCNITLNSDRVTTTSAHLYWSQCSDSDFSSYTLHRGEEAGFTPSEANRLNRGANETNRNVIDYNDSGLKPSTTYYYILVTAHGDTTTSSNTSVKTADLEVPVIEFQSASARAAAGHILDEVHKVTIIGDAKRRTSATTQEKEIVKGEEFTFSFEGNEGSPQKAAFVTTDAEGRTQLVETIKVLSEEDGKVSVRVLSSDKITRSIKVKAQWKDPNKPDSELKDAGDKACNFAAVESKRRYGIKLLNEGSASDTGWDFNSRLLVNPGDSTAATVFLKFRKDTSQVVDTNYFLLNGNKVASIDPEGAGTVRPALDDADKWLAVNGHKLHISIEEITGFGSGSSITPSPQYVYFADKDGWPVGQNGQRLPINDPAAFNLPSYVEVTTGGNGAATIYLKAGPQINQCREIKLKVVEKTQKK